MARPPKGKPLTIRAIRLDDDVWAECQRLGKEHGTINEGMRLKLLPTVNEIATTIPPQAVSRSKARKMLGYNCVPVVDGMVNQGRGNQDPDVPLTRVVAKELKRQNQNWKRGPRQKGDKQR